MDDDIKFECIGFPATHLIGGCKQPTYTFTFNIRSEHSDLRDFWSSDHELYIQSSPNPQFSRYIQIGKYTVEVDKKLGGWSLAAAISFGSTTRRKSVFLRFFLKRIGPTAESFKPLRTSQIEIRVISQPTLNGIIRHKNRALHEKRAKYIKQLEFIISQIDQNELVRISNTEEFSRLFFQKNQNSLPLMENVLLQCQQ